MAAFPILRQSSTVVDSVDHWPCRLRSPISGVLVLDRAVRRSFYQSRPSTTNVRACSLNPREVRVLWSQKHTPHGYFTYAQSGECSSMSSSCIWQARHIYAHYSKERTKEAKGKQEQKQTIERGKTKNVPGIYCRAFAQKMWNER